MLGESLFNRRAQRAFGEAVGLGDLSRVGLAVYREGPLGVVRKRHTVGDISEVQGKRKLVSQIHDGQRARDAMTATMPAASRPSWAKM